MSAPIAKSQMAFQLPNLTYIDARYEEPNLYGQVEQQPKRGIAGWLLARFSAVRNWRRNQSALSELVQMTDRELQDIGVSRADLHRAFDAGNNADLVSRNLG